MRVLVTGAAGHLGGYVIGEPAARGHQLVAVDQHQVQDARLDRAHVGDLQDREVVRPALRGVDGTRLKTPFAEVAADPGEHRDGLRGRLDTRDAATVIRLALTAELPGWASLFDSTACARLLGFKPGRTRTT
ncbi:NAD-dependent epimerase/dehydratase family protein [Streptomyces sp. NPDC057539]|uniref:NAD-dependent epimerase/dehydratase family protein n=1 Tax=Streptomyces sp. NPDC057539 TaxID=3346159 RepID=UPI003682880D